GIVDECVGESVARGVLVTGAAGVGKSRLGQELLRQLKRRSPPIEVWIARGDPIAAGSPFMLASQLLSSAMDLRNRDPMEALPRIRARVGRYVAPTEVERVSDFLGVVLGVESAAANVRLRSAR